MIKPHDIQTKLRRGTTGMTVTWPISVVAGRAPWMREELRCPHRFAAARGRALGMRAGVERLLARVVRQQHHGGGHKQALDLSQPRAQQAKAQQQADLKQQGQGQLALALAPSCAIDQDRWHGSAQQERQQRPTAATALWNSPSTSESAVQDTTPVMCAVNRWTAERAPASMAPMMKANAQPSWRLPAAVRKAPVERRAQPIGKVRSGRGHGEAGPVAAV